MSTTQDEEITRGDMIAVTQSLPITGKAWLDNDIVIAATNSLRAQYAGQIMASMVQSQPLALAGSVESLDAIVELASRLAGRVTLANETFAMEMYDSVAAYGPLTAIRSSAHCADSMSAGLASGSAAMDS